jgi:hypothetical protein
MPELPLFGAATPAQDGTDPICASAGLKPDFQQYGPALCGNAPALQHMGTAVRGYGTAHMMYGSGYFSSQLRTKYKLKGHYSHKRVSCATWDPPTYFFQVIEFERTYTR